MIIFPHDPDHVYFERSLIRMERWRFEFAMRTSKREKCYCTVGLCVECREPKVQLADGSWCCPNFGKHLERLADALAEMRTE